MTPKDTGDALHVALYRSVNLVVFIDHDAMAQSALYCTYGSRVALLDVPRAIGDEYTPDQSEKRVRTITANGRA